MMMSSERDARESRQVCYGRRLQIGRGRCRSISTKIKKRREIQIVDKKRKYTADLPEKMQHYFSDYAESGLPSFGKFAHTVGLTSAELLGMRRHREFEKAYNECKAIRRDYLIDRALEKKFDSSFAKFLISLENEDNEAEDRGDVVVHLEVSE